MATATVLGTQKADTGFGGGFVPSLTVPKGTRTVLLYIATVGPGSPGDFGVTLGGAAVTRQAVGFGSGDGTNAGRAMSVYVLSAPAIGTKALSVTGLFGQSLSGAVAVYARGEYYIAAAQGGAGTSTAYNTPLDVGELDVEATVVANAGGGGYISGPSELYSQGEVKVAATGPDQYGSAQASFSWSAASNNAVAVVRLKVPVIPANQASLLGTQIIGSYGNALSGTVSVPAGATLLLIWICGLGSAAPQDHNVTVGGQRMTRLIGAVSTGDSDTPRQVSLYALAAPPIGKVTLAATLGAPTFYGAIAAFLTGGLGAATGRSAGTGTSLQLGAAEEVGEGYITGLVVRDAGTAHVASTPPAVTGINDLSISYTDATDGLVSYSWDSGHGNYGTSVHIVDASVGKVFAPPVRATGTTTVRARAGKSGSIHPAPTVVTGTTTVRARPLVPGSVHPVLDFILARSQVRAAALVARPPHAQPDPVTAGTVVDVAAVLAGTLAVAPDLVVGSTVVRAVVIPDLSDNEPITLGFTANAEMMLLPADGDDGEDSPWPSGEDQLDRALARAAATGTAPAWTERRAMPGVSLDMPTPIVVAGKPVVPAWLAQLPSAAPVKLGDKHIHATDPAPVWDPRTGGWFSPPPDGPDWDGRWTVDDLPDPPRGGYYWLGDPSAADGTAYYSGAKTRWAPHASTPHAPTWRSFFPYKPSVRAFDSYLPGGQVVHHPRGVHFNSQFVEHMWADFGGVRRQPFSWVIAAMVVGWPSRDYTHYLLDAGRNPDHAGVPRLSASAVYTDHTAHDNLPYRSLLAYSHQRQTLTADGLHSAHAVHARAYPNTRPKMFFGVFNGAASRTGAWSTGKHRHGTGRIPTAASDHHRFYVLGRSQGVISQDRASHMLVFELRFWHSALSLDQLQEQYKQLSSTYQFDRYKAV